MKINERLETLQSRVREVLMESDLNDEEVVVKNLEAIGLDSDSAINLISAFKNAERAKNTAKNVWNTALNSKPGVDFSTDVAESQQQESDSRQYFDQLNARCALLVVAKTTDPNRIDDEILDKLFGEGIQESEIANPALRTTFHYYSESKNKDVQLDGMREAASRIKGYMENLRDQLQNTRRENASLKNAYRNLQKKYKSRVISDEKHYQEALSQIEVLKGKLSELQNRNVFQTIGAKLTGLFGNKKQELPEPTTEIPTTLYVNSSEKMGVGIPDEEDLFLGLEKDTKPTQPANRSSKIGR